MKSGFPQFPVPSLFSVVNSHDISFAVGTPCWSEVNRVPSVSLSPSFHHLKRNGPDSKTPQVSVLESSTPLNPLLQCFFLYTSWNTYTLRTLCLKKEMTTFITDIYRTLMRTISVRLPHFNPHYSDLNLGRINHICNVRFLKSYYKTN